MPFEYVILGSGTNDDTPSRPGLRIIEMEDGAGKALAVCDMWTSEALTAIQVQNAQIIALLTEIRDDQRATQGNTVSGRVTKTKSILDSLL